MERLHADLSLKINQLTDLDIGVWNTPEGQTFIDGEFQNSFFLITALTTSISYL
jgi:hypothetical protein